MTGWLRLIALNAQRRLGLSAGTAIWAALAAIASALALFFLLLATFIWLSARYGSVTAGVGLGLLFLALALIATLASVLSRRRTIERARRELEARRSASAGLLDPKLMAMGYQIGRSIGWRRLVTLAAVAVLAAGAAREWVGRAEEATTNEEPDPES
jgi:membrane protein implicated in regulation of membrane protease activity